MDLNVLACMWHFYANCCMYLCPNLKIRKKDSQNGNWNQASGGRNTAQRHVRECRLRMLNHFIGTEHGLLVCSPCRIRSREATYYYATKLPFLFATVPPPQLNGYGSGVAHLGCRADVFDSAFGWIGSNVDLDQDLQKTMRSHVKCMTKQKVNILTFPYTTSLPRSLPRRTTTAPRFFQFNYTINW